MTQPQLQWFSVVSSQHAYAKEAIHAREGGLQWEPPSSPAC